MKSNLSPHDWQLLSAYLDHQLDARQTSRLEARLYAETTLRQGLQSLEHTRLVLRSAPRRKPPRDFRLDPSTVPSRKFPVLFPVFSFASAVTALLFVILVLVDSPTRLHQQQFEAVQEAAPAAMLVDGEGPEAAIPIEDAELPPVINWAAPPSGPAMGLGGSGGGGGGGDSFAEPMGEGIAPAPLSNLKDTQEEMMEQPEEELAADMAAESPAPSAESEQAPQEKEANSQETPAVSEPLPDPQVPQESAETLREIPETDQTELNTLDTDTIGSEHLPGGPILGIQPSSTPAQIDFLPIEEIQTEPYSTTRPQLKWFFAAAALIFGLVAVVIWRRSQ